MWEPSQATLDKDINGLVLLASAGCRLFGERKHRETVCVLCGGKDTAPGCALQGAKRYQADQVLQAVKFTDKKVNGLHLDLDEDLQAAGCFTEAIRGHQMGVVEPNVMRGLQPAGATRVTLDAIIPSA